MNVSIHQYADLQHFGIFSKAEEKNVLVANALRLVIQNVFANIANDFVLTLCTAGGLLEFWLSDVISKLFSTLGFMAVQFLVHDHETQWLAVTEKHYCNVIIIDSFESLDKANIMEYNRKSDSLEYYFIFIKTRYDLVNLEMRKIFKYCFQNYWINCNIMVQALTGDLFVYTYFPFEENNCFQTKPQVINKFEGNRFESQLMFPDKLRNLNKCPLKLTTWNIPPFVINKTDIYNPQRNISGFETIIMAMISKKMNFTLDINMISMDMPHKNQTPASVAIDMLESRETNITMGYFSRSSVRDQIATPSYITYYLPFVAVVLRKQTRFQSLGILTLPFDNLTWIIVIVAYVIVVLMNSLKQKDHAMKIVQLYYQVFIGMSINNIPQSTLKRIQFSYMLLTTFILRSVYQSLLFHIIRTHFYEAPPLTIDDLIANNYKAICSEMSLNFIRRVPQIYNRSLPLMVIKSLNEMYPLYYLELHRSENLVAISTFDFVLFYALVYLSQGSALQILPTNVNEQQISFYFVKHSYLADRFNYYILSIDQAGLLQKWKQWSNREHLITQNKGSALTSYENILIMNLSQLIGFFFMVFILHLTSIAIFGLELLSKKIQILQKIFNNI